MPEKIIADMKDGDVTLLENVRFHAGEEANDPAFAEALARLGDGFTLTTLSAPPIARMPRPRASPSSSSKPPWDS